MITKLFRAPVGAALMILAFPAAANAADATNGLRVPLSAEAADELKAGQFVWQDGGQGAGAVTILVSLPLQRLFVYRGEALIGISTISSGKPGHDTPVGEFEILEKNQDHRSNIYDNAPMPFMQRLTWDGIAIHGGRIPGSPASHGCIRVPTAFASKLFEVTSLGAKVTVTDYGATSPAELPIETASLDTLDDAVTAGAELAAR
jgi:hypothetical protein